MKEYYGISKIDVYKIYKFEIKEKGTGVKYFKDKIQKEAKNER